MGVMSCSRITCEKIMCDTYIDRIGYVCYECESEFKEYLTKKGINPKTEGEIHKVLNIFMNTSKGSYESGNDIDVDDFFSSYRN